MRQITQHLSLQVQGNQKNNESVNVLTTRSQKVAKEKEEEAKYDDHVIEVELEVREDKKELEEVIPLVKQTEEKNKEDKLVIKLLYPS